MTILTHHAAMAPYGRMLLAGKEGERLVKFLSPPARPPIPPILKRMNYQDRIVIDPEIRFGKPCVRGTRITVGNVLSYLASGMSEQQVLADFSTVGERRHPRLFGVCRRARTSSGEHSGRLSSECCSSMKIWRHGSSLTSLISSSASSMERRRR